MARSTRGRPAAFFGVVASLIGEMAGVSSVPIRFEAEGRRRSLQIPSVLDVSVEGVTGGDQKSEAIITNPQLYAVPGFPIAVAKSVRHSYAGQGIKWDNSGKNGFYSKFAYSP